MIPLICLDVDGTLVGSSGSVRPAVWKAADLARARGQHLALCTARVAIGQSWELAQRLDPNGWHVFHTGAAIIHTGTGEIDQLELPPAAVESLEHTAQHGGWVFEAYTAHEIAVDSDDDLAKRHAELLKIEHRRRNRHDLVGSVVRVQFVVDAAHTETALSQVPTGCVASAASSPIMPGVSFISFTHERASKTYGISRIAHALGISLNQVMMVGDGHNDAEAIGACGFGVAMGDAHASAAAAATFHVATADDDGVAQAIELSATLGEPTRG